MKKSTWIIISLIAVLGLIYFLTKEDQVSVGVKRLKFPVFTADKVNHIEILSKEPVVLRKEKDKWMLELKDKENTRLVRADQSNVASMIDAALQLRSSHYVTNLKEKLPELGLEGDEAIKINIFSNGSPVWNLVLGKNASGSGRYAKLPDNNDVYVVRGSFWPLSRNGINDWRDREIMPIKEGEITSFKLKKSGAPDLVLTKESDEWNFDRAKMSLPKNFRVDRSALASLVSSALNMKASGFIDEPRTLSTPLITIDVSAGDIKQEISFFTGSGDNYLAKRAGDDQIYEISQFNFEKLNKLIEDFRSFNVLNFDKSAVVKLVLHGKEPVIIEKKENIWHIVQPNKLPQGFEFDPLAVDDMVSMVAGLTAERLGNPTKDRPQNENWLRVSLLELTTDKGEKINLYSGKSKNKDEYLIKGNVDEEIYIVKGSQVSTLHSGLNAFKKEEFELPPIDENVQGFESLPMDIQRKLLDAAKKKK